MYPSYSGFAAQPITLWSDYSFAPEWFADVLSDSRKLRSVCTHGHCSK